MENKKFTFELEVREDHSPSRWKFENCNPLDQAAILLMVKQIVDRELENMLNGPPFHHMN